MISQKTEPLLSRLLGSSLTEKLEIIERILCTYCQSEGSHSVSGTHKALLGPGSPFDGDDFAEPGKVYKSLYYRKNS